MVGFHGSSLFQFVGFVPRRELKKLPYKTSLFTCREGLRLPRLLQKVLLPFPHGLEYNRHTLVRLSFTIIAFWTQIYIFFKKYSQNWKSYQVHDNRSEVGSFVLFRVHTGPNCHTSNYEGTSNIQIFFSPQHFIAFFINKCGRYYDIDDSKRLVLEIAHVFIGTILRLNSFGQPILVLKTVLSDKTFKYTSVAKTPISTEFVEYCWYWLSKKNEWRSGDQNSNSVWKEGINVN